MSFGDDPCGWGFGRGGHDSHFRAPFRGFGLKYWVLSLLYEKSATGAMVMDKIENMSMGHWRPSPGHVYPLLDEMTKEGYLEIETKDGKKYYKTTDKGRELLGNSWFPWRNFGGMGGVTSIDDAIKNLEVLSEYILDNREKIKEDEKRRTRVVGIVNRLQEI